MSWHMCGRSNFRLSHQYKVPLYKGGGRTSQPTRLRIESLFKGFRDWPVQLKYEGIIAYTLLLILSLLAGRTIWLISESFATNRDWWEEVTKGKDILSRHLPRFLSIARVVNSRFRFSDRKKRERICRFPIRIVQAFSCVVWSEPDWKRFELTELQTFAVTWKYVVSSCFLDAC